METRKTRHLKSTLLHTLAGTALLALAGGAAAQPMLKMGDATTEDLQRGMGTPVFCDEIAKSTRNRYTPQQFPNSQRGGEREKKGGDATGRTRSGGRVHRPAGQFSARGPAVWHAVFVAWVRPCHDGCMAATMGQDLPKTMQRKGLIGLAWADQAFAT